MKEIKAFIKKYKLSAKDINEEKLLKFFLNEMQKGLDNQKSSLAMIPTYVSDDIKVKANDKVIVLDAGGTNFRTALVSFNKKREPVISDFKKVPMPGSKTQVTKKEFFSQLADQVEHLIDKSDNIGFCFSYAANIDEDRDGSPIVFSKEIKAPEVIGEKVGANLLAELASRGYSVKNKRITVINDTVATLLAAKANAKREYSSYIGFILGTGTNTAYVEKGSKIKKINSKLKSQIINVESGGLDYFISPLDKAFYDTTKNPEVYFFEKMISGAYLGVFADFVIRKAMKEGLFSDEFIKQYESEPNLNTMTMSHYLEMSHNKDYQLVRCVANNEKDGLRLFKLIDSLIERAAKLTAINISAAVLKSSYGKDPRYPVCINADGTTLYKTENLYEYTRMFLKELLENKKNRYTHIVQIDDAPILGAAIAGLTI